MHFVEGIVMRFIESWHELLRRGPVRSTCRASVPHPSAALKDGAPDCRHAARCVWFKLAVGAIFSVTIFAGCGPTFTELRLEGQREFAHDHYGAARQLFIEAHLKQPEDPENLHDMGVSSMMLARDHIENKNRAAALREIDRSIEYFNRSINAHPGFKPALIGKNRALELKGQFDEALDSAHWAATYVGPSADQYIFLAQEYERRGDVDGALLHYRQALAIDPRNAGVHKGIGMMQYNTGRRDLAMRSLHRSLQLDPTQADVAEMLRDMGESVPSVEYGP